MASTWLDIISCNSSFWFLLHKYASETRPNLRHLKTYHIPILRCSVKIASCIKYNKKNVWFLFLYMYNYLMIWSDLQELIHKNTVEFNMPFKEKQKEKNI